MQVATHSDPLKRTREVDAKCRKCGYSLKGLPVGGRCPECGRQIGASSHRSDGKFLRITDSPPRAVGQFRAGAWILTVALVLAGVVGFLTAGQARAMGGIVVSVVWALGVIMLTRSIPRAESTKASLSPSARLARVSQPLWVLCAIFALVADVGGPIVQVLALLMGCGGIFGIVALSVHLGDIAHWADDSKLADRFRVIGWGLAAGAASTGLAGLSLWLRSVYPSTATEWMAGVFGFFAVGGGLVLLLVSMAGFVVLLMHLARLCDWAMSGAAALRAREQRRLDKAAKSRESHDADAAVARADAPLGQGYRRDGPQPGKAAPRINRDSEEFRPYGLEGDS